MKSRQEHPPAPDQQSKRFGEGLTPEQVAKWGLSPGQRINLFDRYPGESPFEVVLVGFQSERYAFGVIIESTVTHKKYVLIPGNSRDSLAFPCSDDEYEQGLEQASHGELVPKSRDDK